MQKSVSKRHEPLVLWSRVSNFICRNVEISQTYLEKQSCCNPVQLTETGSRSADLLQFPILVITLDLELAV